MTKSKFKRVFHHWERCEEYKTQMWKAVPVEVRESYITKSADLMVNTDAFFLAMCDAVNQWPNSCEAALTASAMNHQAWMGHAGCAINHDAPEDLTRLAWRTLTQEQQDRANDAADRAIAYWCEKYKEKLNAEARARN